MRRPLLLIGLAAAAAAVLVAVALPSQAQRGGLRADLDGDGADDVAVEVEMLGAAWQKGDVHHSEITALYALRPLGRARIATREGAALVLREGEPFGPALPAGAAWNRGAVEVLKEEARRSGGEYVGVELDGRVGWVLVSVDGDAGVARGFALAEAPGAAVRVGR